MMVLTMTVTLDRFLDGKCNSLWPQQQSRQEQITVATPEICDDDLDNDVDGKVDSRDEGCSSTTRSSFPSPRQAQSVTDEQIKEGEDDKEKPSNEDVPKNQMKKKMVIVKTTTMTSIKMVKMRKRNSNQTMMKIIRMKTTHK